MAIGDFLAGLPVIGGLFDSSAEDIEKQLKKQEGLYDDKSNYAKYLGTYKTEQVDPSLVQEDPRMKDMQMQYLSKLMSLSDEGLSDQDRSVFDTARREAESAAARQSAAIQQQMRERGIGGSGAELALRQQASQAAINQQAQAGTDQAAAAAKQRALYNQAYGQAASDVRGQDYRTLAGNTDTQNRIAQFNAQNTNDAAKYGVQTRQDLENARMQTRLAGLSGLGMERYNRLDAQAAARREQRKAAGKAVGSAIGAAAGGPQGAEAGAKAGEAIGGPIGDLF